MILEITLISILVLSLIAIQTRDLLYAVIILGAADLLAALAFFFMAAPDIAMTQAVVTSGLSIFIFMVVINKTRRMEDGKN